MPPHTHTHTHTHTQDKDSLEKPVLDTVVINIFRMAQVLCAMPEECHSWKEWQVCCVGFDPCLSVSCVFGYGCSYAAGVCSLGSQCGLLYMFYFVVVSGGGALANCS